MFNFCTLIVTSFYFSFFSGSKSLTHVVRFLLQIREILLNASYLKDATMQRYRANPGKKLASIELVVLIKLATHYVLIHHDFLSIKKKKKILWTLWSWMLRPHANGQS